MYLRQRITNFVKTSLAFGFIFGVLTTSYGQEAKIDSLKSLIELSAKDEDKLLLLEKISDEFINTSINSESFNYFNDFSKIAKKLKKHKLETKGYKYISEYFIKSQDSIHAKEYALKSLAIDSKSDSIKYYLRSINQLGRVYYHFQNYEKAVETYNIGIDKFEKNNKNPIPSLSSIYSNLSHAYDKLGKKKESIDAILKGVNIAEKTNNPTQKAYGLYALGYKYMELENYPKAEKYFLKSLTYSDSVSLQTYVYMNHHGLGINFSRWGKYKKALKHNEIALEFYRKHGNRLYEFDVLNNTAAVYTRMKKPDSVLIFGKLALQVAEEINNKLAISGAKLTLSNAYINLKQYNKAEEFLLEVAKDTINIKIIDKNSKVGIYSNLSEVYEGQNDFKKGLKFHKKYKKLNDSIQKEKLDSKFLELESKYQFEQKQNTILKQDIKIRDQAFLLKEKQNTLLISLIILSVVILVLGFVYQKRRKEKIKNDNLTNQVLLLESKLFLKNQDLANRKDEFNSFLTKEYNLTKALLDYWDRQAYGSTEKEMENIFGIAKRSVRDRRIRLYEKLSAKTGTKNYNRHGSVSLYIEEIMDFMNTQIAISKESNNLNKE